MFKKIGSLGRFGGPVLVDRVITNSVAAKVGDAVKTVDGFAALATAGDPVLGHVESVFTGVGFSPLTDGTGGAALGSFRGNIGDSYTAASDNETVDQVAVRVDIATDSIYSADADAALETTTGSSLAGKYFDVVDENDIDESSVTATRVVLTEGTPNTIAYLQYYSHGEDRNESDNVIVNITSSEVFGA